MIRRKACGNIVHAPNWSIKIRQAETNKGFVSIYSMGLFESYGCPPKASGGLPLQEKKKIRQII
jgi:hypothetical protein